MAQKNQTLAELQIQLSLQSEKLEAGIKEVDRQLKSFEAQTKRANSSFGKLEATLVRSAKGFALLAGAIVVNELQQAAFNALAFADAIGKTADKVGVSAVELQQLRFAAEQSGVGVNSLDMALQRFARRMGEAAKGTGELYKTTQELGIVFEDANGNALSTVELLRQYAQALGEAGTQQEKLRLAFKAFDSEGAALVNLFGDGTDALDNYIRQAEKFNLIISEESVRAAEALTDRLNIISTSLTTSVTEAFVSATTAALEFFGVFTTEAAAQKKFDELEAQIVKLSEAYTKAIADGNEGYAQTIAGWIQILGKEIASVNDELELLKVIETEKKFEDLGVAAEEASDKLQSVADRVTAALDPLDKYKKQVEGVEEAWLAGLITLEQAGAYVAKIAEEAYAATDPLGQFQEKVNAVLEQTSFDRLAEQLGVLYAALEQATSPAQREKIQELIEEIEGFGDAADGVEKLGSVIEESAKKIKDAMDGFAADFTNNLVDSLAEGELAFEDFAKNILKTIAKIVLNEIFTRFFTALTSPLFDSIGIGKTSISPIPLPDDLTRDGAVMPQSFAVGSPIFSSSTGSRQSPVTVNVMNYGNDDVEVDQRNTGNGIEIDVLIKNTVRNGFADGSFDRVMSSTYGARRLGY